MCFETIANVVQPNDFLGAKCQVQLTDDNGLDIHRFGVSSFHLVIKLKAYPAAHLSIWVNWNLVVLKKRASALAGISTPASTSFSQIPFNKRVDRLAQVSNPSTKSY